MWISNVEVRFKILLTLIDVSFITQALMMKMNLAFISHFAASRLFASVIAEERLLKEARYGNPLLVILYARSYKSQTDLNTVVYVVEMKEAEDSYDWLISDFQIAGQLKQIV